MKRTLSLILILTMLLSLAACGSKDAAPTDDGNVPSQEQGGGEEQSGGTTGTPTSRSSRADAANRAGAGGQQAGADAAG